MNITHPPLLVKESTGSFEIDFSLNTTTSKDIVIQAMVASGTASGNNKASHFTHIIVTHFLLY